MLLYSRYSLSACLLTNSQLIRAVLNAAGLRLQFAVNWCATLVIAKNTWQVTLRVQRWPLDPRQRCSSAQRPWMIIRYVIFSNCVLREHISPHDHMQLAFFGTDTTFAIPCGSQVIAQLPREHRLVKNGSIGDLSIEGSYLYSGAPPHLASGCSALWSNARSKCKISSPILFNSLSWTRNVLCATCQRCWINV